MVLAVENKSHHGGNLEVNVLFADFRVMYMSGAASQEIFDEIAKGQRPVRYSGHEGEMMRK